MWELPFMVAHPESAKAASAAGTKANRQGRRMGSLDVRAKAVPLFDGESTPIDWGGRRCPRKNHRRSWNLSHATPVTWPGSRLRSAVTFMAAMARLLPVANGMDNEIMTVSPPRTPEGVVFDQGCTGIAIDTLEPGTTLLVHTANSKYGFVVIDPREHQVLIAGGAFRHAVPAFLHGASGDRDLKSGWIGVGLRMRLFVDGKPFVTSRVRFISQAH